MSASVHNQASSQSKHKVKQQKSTKNDRQINKSKKKFEEATTNSSLIHLLLQQCVLAIMEILRESKTDKVKSNQKRFRRKMMIVLLSVITSIITMLSFYFLILRDLWKRIR